jgi:hydrogenase-1 operon protein HyaE
MTSPLVARLTSERGWPLLDDATLDDWIAGPGERVLFVTGDAGKNLETNDVAVILPELAMAFRGRFLPAVVAQPVERRVRERFEVWPTPSLIFLRDGAAIGAIPKVRDWDDYVTRTRMILDGAALAAE